MSSLFIHVGQCGNQLAIPLWENIGSATNESDKHVFRTLDGFQRSIHIDSEPKVVKTLPKLYKIRKCNVILGKRGRGSNFALGYHGIKTAGDDHVLQQSVESIRKEIERCDTYSGAVVVHSVGGGTGSGLGAHVIECLREEFPCSQILSCVVAPCLSGESPLQSYNALLSLHWLHNYADATVFLQNDLLIERAKGPNCEERSQDYQVSFSDINKIAAHNLSGLFLPTDTLRTSRGVCLGHEPWEIVRTLAPMTTTNFLSIGHYNSSKLSWSAISSKAFRQIPKYDYDGQIIRKSLSATVVARGDARESFMSEVRQGLDKKMKRGLRCIEWNPFPIDCWTAKCNSAGPKGKNASCSISVAVNSSCVIDYFNVVLEQAEAKLNVGAYLQWYKRYGMDKEIFEESIETLQEIVQQYEEAVK